MTIPDTLLVRTARWLALWPQMSVSALVMLVVGSALGVIYSAHETRQLYAELQALEKRQDFLDSEYEKLLLEQSAWAAYTRVDKVSHEELKMATPASADVVVVSR